MENLILLFALFVKAKLNQIFVVLLIITALISSAYSQPLQLGQSVVTTFAASNDPTYNVVKVIDTRNIPPFVVGGNHWIQNQFSGTNWTFARMRNVFGITLDNATPPNIFVASSTVYCDQPVPNDSILIFRIDGATWQVTNYIAKNPIPGPPQTGPAIDWIPNTGPNLGNLCFDKFHRQLFTTNHEDGRIYCVRDNGAGRGEVYSWYDPFAPNNDADAGFAPRRERLWGIGSYGTDVNNVRVYFSRWQCDDAVHPANVFNEIWSIALNSSGDFVPSSVRLEITLPILPPAPGVSFTYSNPVSDIEFSFAGTMLVGERTMLGNSGDCVNNPGAWAHRSRVLEYPRNVLGLYNDLIYTWHKVGAQVNQPIFPFKCNSAGGVDYDFGQSDSVTNMIADCDSNIVVTGDYLFAGNFASYGVQVTDRSSAGVNNQEDFSHYIDLNGISNLYDKTTTGDVDVYRKDLCADTSCISILSDTVYCDSTGAYVYEFNIKNNSPTKYIEELEITVDSPQPPNWVVAIPSTINIFPPIPPLGSSGVKKVKLIGPGAVATSEVCYTLSAHFVNDDCPWCCFIENCIKLPICDTCAVVIQDSIYCVNGNYYYNFTLKNGTLYNVSKIQLTSPGTNVITFVPQTFHFGTPILPNQVFPNLTAQILGGSAGMNIPVRIKLFDSTSECCYFELPYRLPPCDTFHVDLTSFIEGRYDQTTNSMVGDTIEVELRNSTSPYGLVEASRGYLNSSGNITLDFYYVQNAVNYYIVLKHRNSMETWSKSPGQSFSGGVLNFDFLTASQAYGFNLGLIDSTPIWYGILSGDVNQDGIVDIADVIAVYNDAISFVTGYVLTDLTGDECVDASDLMLTSNNSSAFVNLIRP